MRILIVEDEPTLRETLRDLLELEGHEVLAAADGVEGVDLARQKPEFILCDIDMPRLDGLGVLAAVKAMPELSTVPFVFLTGRDQRKDLRTGMGQGADDYLTKPFQLQEVLDAIAARTRRQRPWREELQRLTTQRKQEATAAWSHELLTPLNAILGSLDLLESEADTISREELKEILGFLRQGAVRQERLSRKLIFFFHIEQMLQGTLAARRGPCSAAAAIAAGVARATKDSKRAADVEVTAAEGLVGADEELLAFAIGEVVANALGFSAAGTMVIVTGERSGDGYRIEVADQGCGMTAEQCASIGPFKQFGRDKREQQGLGLGLAIAAGTVKVAGGRLGLEPTAPEGLRVTFELPLAPGAGS